ncbi:dihydrodipicolinate synthase family protein [Oceanimonas doudoroffii]|uniref:Dihydrodipicolinate synthase family protein n=1 Tax=Oceanimonas doudoroffii TaxID=84158 RepID=A0A233RIH3_9GAMM|nr:dihydrodipicolinate synthase family protein [Oceanimonas doudoroffii]OXY83191.1 dihydrodipicolinate synthase family protein [Oceanimonas doudoroffii]
MSELNGINLAMQTPFDSEGKVNYARFEELIEMYLDAGIHGFVLSSGTGQHAYLTEDECNKLFEIGAKRINGRANIIAQSSALNLDEAVRRAKTAQDLGAQALMVLPPFFEGPKHDDGVFAFYELIGKSVDIDVIAYSIPSATGIEISPALFSRLIQLGNVNYIKDSSGDFCKTQALLKVSGGKVLNGADPLAPYAFMAGAVGSIWGGANFMPREAVELYELVKLGHYDNALKLWEKMFPAIEYIWNNDYIPAVKAGARMTGFDGGPVRAPVCEINDQEKEKLKAALSFLKN